MIIAFWVIATNLIIIALLIIIVPIWFQRNIKLDDNQQHNLAIGRQKLVDLKIQLAQNNISTSEYNEQLTELELALNEELSTAQGGNTKAHQGRWIIALIIPLLPISAISLYLTLGTPQILEAPPTPAQEVAQHA